MKLLCPVKGEDGVVKLSGEIGVEPLMEFDLRDASWPPAEVSRDGADGGVSVGAERPEIGPGGWQGGGWVDG